MNEATAEHSQKSAILVTKNEHEKIFVDHGVINAVPMWRLLLDLSEVRAWFAIGSAYL